jgi:hypothetical protein
MRARPARSASSIDETAAETERPQLRFCNLDRVDRYMSRVIKEKRIHLVRESKILTCDDDVITRTSERRDRVFIG